MSRKKLWIINLICWTLGLAFVLAGAWVLDQLLQDGFAKTALEWILIGVAITLFGGVPFDLTRQG